MADRTENIDFWIAQSNAMRRQIDRELARSERSFVVIVERHDERLRLRLTVEAAKFAVTEEFIISTTVENLEIIARLNGIVRDQGAALSRVLTGTQKIATGGVTQFELVTPRSWTTQRLARMEQLAFSHTRRSSRNLERFFKAGLKEVDVQETKLKARIAKATSRRKSILEDKLRFLAEDKRQLRERLSQHVVPSRRRFREGAAARSRRRVDAFKEITKSVENMTAQATQQVEQITVDIFSGDAKLDDVLKKFNKIEFPDDQSRHRSFMQLKGHYESERHEEELAGLTDEQKREQFFIHRGPLDNRTTKVSKRYLGKIKTRAEWMQVAIDDPDVPGGPQDVFRFGLFWGERGHFDLLPPDLVEAFGIRNLQRAG